MAGIDQNTLWQLASMILGKSKAQPTTRERATFLRTDSDGTQWVRLPSSNDETPVNGRTLATAKPGDTVEWSIDNGRLSITGNSTSPSVGSDYVGQEVSVVTKRVDAVKADIIETNELLATKATITELEAESARIDTIEADVADIDTIRANSAKVQNLTAAQLEADHAKVGQLDVDQIEADHATIGTLDTIYMHADMANAGVAWIQNGTIKDGSIVSAMINDVSANKLTAGTINGSVINVTNLNADNITAGTINGQRIGEGSLSLDKLSENVYTESEVDNIVDGLNDRIDGAIETHTGTAVPTLNNSPASSWNTTKLRDEHVGDVYYVVNSQSQQNGYCYRFTKSGSTYSWQLIKDSDVTAALSRLNTAENKITSIESFDSTVSSFMTNTDSELTSVKSRATSLETRMTDAEGDISEKVDTSTFNTLSQTVDENSASITSMGTVLTNNGLTSSTNITNTVNTVSQTATGNSSKITQLTTTLGTNADGTTKTGDVVHRTSAVEQDLSGFKTTVAQTYATNTTVDGIATRVSTAESNITQNANNIALKVSETDVTGNYLIGKINLDSTTASIAAQRINLQGAVTISDLSSDAQSATLNSNISVGGRNIAKASDAVVTPTTYGALRIYLSEPLEAEQTYVFQLWDVDVSHSAKSTAQLGVDVYYCGGNIKMSGWHGSAYFTNGHADHLQLILTPHSSAATDAEGGSETTSNPISGASSVTNKYINLYNSVPSATGTMNLTVGKWKLEKGNKATDWSPAPEDVDSAISNAAETATSYVTNINDNGITVHPKRSDYATNGGRAVINGDGLTIYLGSDDVASYGASARIGKANSDRVTVDSTNGITIYKGNSKRLQTTANGIDVYGSDGTTSIASFGSTVVLGNASDGSVVTIDSDSMDMGHGSTEMLHFGYGDVASGSGTTTAPYYTLGTRNNIDFMEYNPNLTYKLGKLVTYDGAGYVCISAITTPEPWNSAHWRLAVGAYSIAEGNRLTASGTFASAEGYYTKAVGHYSHAEGIYSETYGRHSRAQNEGTIAASDNQTALGHYNVADTNGTYAVIVGNGFNDSNRSNALTVDWDGNVAHGVDVPWTNLQLASSVEPYSSGQTPRYRKWGPVVQVIGAVKLKSNQSAGFNVNVGTLPSGCRPLTQVATVCQGSGNDTWLCNVSAGGLMNIERYRNGGTSAAATTSTWFSFSITFLTA